MVLVQAIFNGQGLSIEEEEISFMVEDMTFIVFKIGYSRVRFHLDMVFILQDNKIGDGKRTFKLATHEFTFINIIYESDGLHERISDFCSTLCSAPLMKKRKDALKVKQFDNNDNPNLLLMADYKRLGMSDGLFRISTANGEFKLCPTYPIHAVTMASLSDSVLRHAAKYRSRSRFPIISYRHQNGALLLRSSQPMVGIQGHRSVQDERLIEAFRMASPRRQMLVVDARHSKSAMANAIKGGGSMLIEHYAGCEQIYLGIDNIHGVRGTYLKIFELLGTGKALRSAKQEAGWIKLYETLMNGVHKIIEHMHDGSAVLVHCSDGWDRTAQIVSLVQICLDPYYRTIEGFMTLVQKEWIATGHQFEHRLAHHSQINFLLEKSHSLSRVLDRFSSTKDEDSTDNPKDEFCPIFPQFLDALLQLLRVYPNHFEFNLDFVMQLWREAFIIEYDTFKMNSELERHKIGLPQQGLWKCINAELFRYMNPSYRPASPFSLNNSNSTNSNNSSYSCQNSLEITKDVLCYI